MTGERVMTWIVDGQPWESDTLPVTQVRPAKMERLGAAGFDVTGVRSPFHPGEEEWLIAEGAVYWCNVCDVEFRALAYTWRLDGPDEFKHGTVTHKVEECEG